MAIFRSKSGREFEDDQRGGNSGTKEQYKASAMHDPILSAMNEAQPFEQAADYGRGDRRPSYLSQDSQDLKDIFGNPIRQSDMSNPTRSRNERPLDTIRGFEYAITGDLAYRDQLETTRLGWGFHEDFSPYNLTSSENANGDTNYDRPVINFNSGGEQPIYAAGNYSAASLKPEKKKKKRGLFGKKK
ncbi:uncharacterized protein PRCAT00002028001 [Priceomyces carsonii]|uniref:uncharacterized protein n=1 Tax=Priceomyces carsonii TaxID=28549 RepID=UPI002EDB899B|nr:unnamed protein product [Priceomyces carsonii]